MKQVIQDSRTGRVSVEDLPAPTLSRGSVLVRTAASVVSAGTERDMLSFARKSMLAKARERPDLVRQVVEKARRDGIAEAYNSVTSRLDNPTPLGYSSAGVVIGVAPGVEGLGVGDRVACAGAGYAVHAEIVAVPRNLCVRIPDRADSDIPFEEAAFATLGAVALQGVRLIGPTLGERVVVIGAGVVGQLASQFLRAHGCSVFVIDRDPARVALARELGAEAGTTPDGGERAAIAAFSRGRGADAVLIAAATPSNEPIELAGEVSRRKGRIVVVGNVGMHIPRRSYYERELSVTVSSSYGPGRYDQDYEEHGIDYPIAYVRWTEQRNMEAVLDTVAMGGLRVARLISHRFPVERAAEAFELIGEQPAAPSLGIVLTYPTTALEQDHGRTMIVRPSTTSAGVLGVGAIGAGSFARATLFPRLQRASGVRLRAVAASTGASASSAARSYGFELATTEAREVLADPGVTAVFVLTQHSLHAGHVLSALQAGKHVFVEKPLCVTPTELDTIASAYRALAVSANAPVLTVGFNRRFSPLALQIRRAIADRGPLTMSYRVNAGPVPADHWLRDPAEGGRIVGEACHFIDLAAFLSGAGPRRVFASGTATAPEPTTLVVEFSDGSVLDLVYAQDGPRRLPKERLEVFQGGHSWTLDDWHSVTAYDDRAEKRSTARGQQKGHEEELAAFFAAVREGGALPIPFESLVATTATTFAALESMRSRVPVDVPVV